MDNGQDGSAISASQNQVEDDPVKWQWYLFLIPVVLVFFGLVGLVWRLSLARKKAKRRQSILRNVHLVQADIEKERHRLERGGSIASRVSRMASTKSRRNSSRRRSSLEKSSAAVGSAAAAKSSSKPDFHDEKSNRGNVPQDHVLNLDQPLKSNDLEAALDPSLVAEEGVDPDAISNDTSHAPITSATRPNQLRRNETNALSVIGESAASETNGSPESQPDLFVSKADVKQAEQSVQQEKEVVAAPPAPSTTSHTSPFDDDNAALSSAHSHSPSNSLSHSASLSRHNMRALSQREASAATTASSGATHNTQALTSPSTSIGTLALAQPAVSSKSTRTGSGSNDAVYASPNTSVEEATASNPFASPTSPLARGASGSEASEVASTQQHSADGIVPVVTPTKRTNVVRVREPVPRGGGGGTSSDAESISAAAGEAQKKRRGSTDAWTSKASGSGSGDGKLGLKRSLSLLTSNALRRSSTSNSSVSGSPAGKSKERGRSQVERDSGAGGKGMFGLGLVRSRSPIAVASPAPMALDASGGGWTYVPRAGDWVGKASGSGVQEGDMDGPLSTRLPGATVSASNLPLGAKRGADAVGGPSLPSSVGMGGVQQVRSASIGPGAVGGGTPTWLAGSALARKPSIGVAGSRYKESFDDT